MPYVIDMQPARGASPHGARAYVPHSRYYRPGPPPFPRAPRALGAGSPAGEQAAEFASGGASVASGIATATGAAASVAAGTAGTLATVAVAAIPIVGAVAALGALLAQFIGGGCGSACVNAAETEQIYEAAADNLLAVGKAGMITRDEAIAGMQALIQAGVQHEAQLATKQGQAGSGNLTKVINAEIAAFAGRIDHAARGHECDRDFRTLCASWIPG